MSPHGQDLLKNVFLVACGAGAGALAGGFVATQAPERVQAETQLRERIVELERRAESETASDEGPRRRRRVADAEAERVAAQLVADSAGQAASATAGGTDGDARTGVAAGGDDVVAASPEFVRSVRSALDTIRREDARAKEIQKLRGERAKYISELDRRLTNYQETLGLTDEQVETLRTTATEGMDDVLRARARGVEGEELAAMERARQREIRDVVGGPTYRELRKLQLDEIARPTIVSVAGQAGVDREQRDRIERLLEQHIEGLVDLDVRARTEDLEPDERAAIREKLDAANRAAWDRLRNEILDADQRERVPLRLR